jgi:hypothetical protein
MRGKCLRTRRHGVRGTTDLKLRCLFTLSLHPLLGRTSTMESCQQLSQPPASTNPAELKMDRIRHERRIAAYPHRAIPTHNGRRRLTLPVLYTPGGPIPGTQNMTASRGRTYPQTHSPLFRLPGKLRNMVYDFVIDGHTFHVLVNEVTKTLGHLMCTNIACAPKNNHGGHAQQCLAVQLVINSAGMRKKSGGTSHNLLPILQSCREM